MKLIPVIGDETVQCYDIYVNDKWYGSRRTKEQCDFWYEQFLNPPIEPAKPEAVEEKVYIVPCTVCGKKVFVNSLDKGRKWHGCINKEDSHFFEV